MHDVGLAGHAPGQGFPFNVMTDQNSNSYSLSAWDQFALGWLDDSQVYCLTRSKIANQVIGISPMEREDSATKTVVIPLNNYSAIVIESHAPGRWSSSKNPNTKMPAGFYGVMVYRVDTRFGNDRRFEIFYGNDVSNGLGNSDPNAKPLDNGNDVRFPKYAYFVPVEGGPSNPWTFFSAYGGPAPKRDYVAIEGDQFITDGIKIEFVKTGDLNQVKVSITDSKTIDYEKLADLDGLTCNIPGVETAGMKIRNLAGFFTCIKRTSDGARVWIRG